MKLNFEPKINDKDLKLINTSDIPDRRMRVTFFKEHGKYYDSTEFLITTEDAKPDDHGEEVYDLVTQASEFIKNYESYRGMHAVIEFQNNDCGYPLMVPASERQ